MVFVMIMRMRMGHSVMGMLVRVFLAINRLVPMRMIMMTVIVRVFVSMGQFIVAVGV